MHCKMLLFKVAWKKITCRAETCFILVKKHSVFFTQALCLFSVSNQINRVPRKSPPVCFQIKDPTPLPMTIERGRQEWPDGAAFTGEWRENYAEATGAFAPYEILEGYRKVYGGMGKPYKMLDYRWENHRLNWIFNPCLILPDFTFVGSFLWWAIPPEFSGIVMTRNRNT